jgi:hypothetical protein
MPEKLRTIIFTAPGLALLRQRGINATVARRPAKIDGIASTGARGSPRAESAYLL